MARRGAENAGVDSVLMAKIIKSGNTALVTGASLAAAPPPKAKRVAKPAPPMAPNGKPFPWIMEADLTREKFEDGGAALIADLEPHAFLSPEDEHAGLIVRLHSWDDTVDNPAEDGHQRIKQFLGRRVRITVEALSHPTTEEAEGEFDALQGMVAVRKALISGLGKNTCVDFREGQRGVLYVKVVSDAFTGLAEVEKQELAWGYINLYAPECIRQVATLMCYSIHEL